MSDKEEQESEEGVEELLDEDGDGEEGNEEDSGSGTKKILMFVVLPILILAVIGGGLYFTGFLDSFIGGNEEGDNGDNGDNGDKGDKHAPKKKNSHGGGDGGGGGGAGLFLEIPAMIVNLKTADGVPRYLRLSVQLELESQEDIDAVEAVIPRVIDQFQTYLRELRVKDLRGSAGIYRLQMELLWRVNQASAPIEVKDVLFQEILIQ